MPAYDILSYISMYNMRKEGAGRLISEYRVKERVYYQGCRPVLKSAANPAPAHKTWYMRACVYSRGYMQAAMR